MSEDGFADSTAGACPDERLRLAQRFERLFHTDLVGMALLNRRTGQVDDCNEKLAEFFGRRREDFLGRHVSAFEPFFPSREHYQQLLITWASGARVRNLPIHSALPDGGRRDGLVTLESLPDTEDKGVVDVAVIVDITDQRRLEAQLRQAHRLESVGRLASGVAHEFNNVLAIISGFVDVLESAGRTNRTSRSAIEEMRRACTRGANLTGALLTFSRRSPMEPDAVDFHVFLDDAIAQIRALLGDAVRIEMRLAATTRHVRIDRVEFEKILVEVARNARDAMCGRGTFAIETADAGAELRLSLRDSGAGMDVPTLDRSFEPFFTTKPVGQGTGLGLAVAYGVVQQSGGRVRAVSSPGGGTTIEIHLPVIAAEPSQTAAAFQHETPIVTGSEAVLVMDTDRSMAMLIEPFLSHLGYGIVHVAPEDQPSIDDMPADIVVLVGRIGAPRREVSQALRRLRRARPRCPVAVISERPAGARVILRDLSIAHVRMPFALAELAVTIRQLLDRK